MIDLPCCFQIPDTKIQNTKYQMLDTAPIKHPMSSTRLTDRQTDKQNGIRTDKQTACLFIFNSVPGEPAEVSMCCRFLICFLPSLANQPTKQCAIGPAECAARFNPPPPLGGRSVPNRNQELTDSKASAASAHSAGPVPK